MRTWSLWWLAAFCVSLHGFLEAIPLSISDWNHGLVLFARYLLPLPLLPGKAISKMAASVSFTPIKLQVAWEVDVCNAGWLMYGTWWNLLWASPWYLCHNHLSTSILLSVHAIVTPNQRGLSTRMHPDTRVSPEDVLRKGQM